MFLQKKINPPKYLHEVHGAETTVGAFAGTYIAAVLTAIVVFFLMEGNIEHAYAYIIFALLAVDIGGGVISNFTRGTEAYYNSKKASSRRNFLLMHLVQPVILGFLFPAYNIILILTGVVIVGIAFGIQFTPTGLKQKGASIVSTIIGLGAIFYLFNDAPALWFLMSLYLIKLITAHAVNWYDSSKAVAN